jgi:hypothetical protein
MKGESANLKEARPPYRNSLTNRGCVVMSDASKRHVPTKLQESRLYDVLERFKEALQGSDQVDLADYLPGPADPLRLPALREMIRIDLELRWLKYQGIPAEDYVKRFRELASDPGSLVHLAVLEYYARKQTNNPPSLESYRQRFPELFEEIRDLVSAATVYPTCHDSSLPMVWLTQTNVIAAHDPESKTPNLQPSKSSTPRPAAFGHGTAMGQGFPIVPPQQPQNSSEGMDVGEGYRLIKRIGGGTFADVWHGLAPGGIDVAIKVERLSLKEDDAKRSLEALDLVKRLRNPFLLQVQASWEREGRLHIAMELADCSLRDRLKQFSSPKTGIPLDELLPYLREVSEALDYLHSRQVLHRDIKPDNILLLAGHAKVADLGLAQLRQQAGSFEASTKGSPMYMPPEVWHGRVSASSDQYSLAATYVEARLHRSLFTTTNFMDLVQSHIGAKPNLESLPLAEQKVLLKALAKNSRQRYESCMQFYHALAATVAQERGKTEVTETPPPKPLPLRALLAAAILTLLVAGAALFGFLRGHGDDSEQKPPPIVPDPGKGLGKKQERAPANPTWRKFLPPHCQPVLGWAIGACTVGRAVPGPALPDVVGAATAVHIGKAGVISDGDRELLTRIQYVFDATGSIEGAIGPIEFVLVGPRKDGPPPFYIMTYKVSNKIFAAFERQASPEIRKVLENCKWKTWVSERDPKGALHEDWPVVCVPANAAMAFAHWLGGTLPSASQWDEAGGRNVDGACPFKGPFLTSPEPWPPEAVGLLRQNVLGGRKSRPVPVTSSALWYESFYGCRDMAANCREWTRTIYQKDEKAPDKLLEFGKAENPHTPLITRGASYNSHTQFCWDETLYPDQRELSSWMPDLSFRVVIEIPSK